MKALRPAAILSYTPDVVTVAALRLMPSPEAARRGSIGHLVFSCPFCCGIHRHGYDKKSPVVPHCNCEYCRLLPGQLFRPPFAPCRANKLPAAVKAVFEQLTKNWQFCPVEMPERV